MRLSQQTISDFQDAYRKDFGEELTKEEARLLAVKLMNLMAIVYRSISNQRDNE